MKCIRSCIGGRKIYNINGRKYIKVRSLAEGGYSFVVEVKDSSGLRYAVKCVRLQLEEQERAMEAEVKAYNSISSDYVMRLIDHGFLPATNKSDKMAYLLFPLMKKGSVQDYITLRYFQKPVVPENLILKWSLDLCRGVEAFHCNRPPLAHRDIKPGNMMISEDDRIVLTDLGSVAEGRITVTSRKEALALQELAATQCTSSYRAPELFELILVTVIAMFAGRTIAIPRLKEEYGQWQCNHPKNVSARPATLVDGSIDFLFWECSVPGQKGTPWEGGHFYLTLQFDEHYPRTPPIATFAPRLFHPNVFPSGRVALSILSEAWSPSLTIRDVLQGIRLLLNEPNVENPANAEAYATYVMERQRYDQIIRDHVREMSLSSPYDRNVGS